MNDEMTLSAYLASAKMSKQELGRRVGCSGEHIGRIVKGDPRVSPALALRIFDETGIRVGPLQGCSNTEIAVVRRVLVPQMHGAAA